jgi:hypothetical protein
MTASGPRIDSRLVAALERLDDPSQPIAETCQRLGQVARELRLVRPSYEQVRVLVHEARSRRRRPSTGEVLLDVAFRSRPPIAIMESIVDTLPDAPRRARDR